MKAKEYILLGKCVEDGIQYGINRAHKHTDAPTREHLSREIENAIMNEICAWFDFGDGNDEKV